MFRQMRRIKQQISDAECIEILIQEPRGVLSLIGNDGYPYGIPLNHYYDPAAHKLYFHGAKQGHKIDAIQQCDKASFCVYDKGQSDEGEWALHIRSVIAFGRIRPIDDIEQAAQICTHIAHKFTSDEQYIQNALTHSLPRTQCFEMTIEHMTGKRVKEA